MTQTGRYMLCCSFVLSFLSFCCVVLYSTVQDYFCLIRQDVNIDID